tara:strand:- start:5124 stop:5477 length:354 start_codon:yes stop_codon:yes gene_type:complete
MKHSDNAIRDALRQERPMIAETPPSFDSVFSAAEEQVRVRRRGWAIGVAVTAMVAVLTIALLPAGKDEITYLDVEELAATTLWTAPSDSLLPEYQFDIYRDMPRLFESTDPDGGALL